MAAEAALAIIGRFGTDYHVEGAPGRARIFQKEPIHIIFLTVDTGNISIADGRIRLDIWYENKKMFSISWNSFQLRDYELIRLRRGPWIAELLELAEGSSRPNP